MNIERFKNNASTTLSAAIGTGDTSISVADGSVFPSAGDFRLLIGAEQLLCTARSGNTLTVLRGAEGTSAAAHGSGVDVVHNLTAGALSQFMADNVPSYGRPPFRLVDSSGNTLTSADFTAVNLSDSTISDQDGSICLRMAASGSSTKLTVLTRSAPATPNSLIVALQPVVIVDTTGKIPVALAGFRESSSGKMVTIGLQNQGGVVGVLVQKYDSETSLNSTPFAKESVAMTGPALWLKVEDDGTNLTFYVGDGLEWVAVYSEARTTFLSGGPDQFVWGSNVGADGFDTLNRLVAWQE